MILLYSYDDNTKPDYKNWFSESMLKILYIGAILSFILFILLGGTGAVLHGISRIICAILFGVSTLALTFFAV